MSKHLSPTAQLLRSSRLFSIPQSLPRPVIETQIPLGFRRSDTATTPYPIRQVLTTPDSSLCRGDWGLKRPLPVRSTSESSNPSLRITGLDTIEHITDYESASDHAKTLEKFQEMNFAMSRTDLQNRVSGSTTKGAFNSDYDYTDRLTTPAPDSRYSKSRRWKFTGPFVKGMTEGEFEKYVHSNVKGRKSKFEKFLEVRLRTQFLEERRKVAVSEQQMTAMQAVEKDDEIMEAKRKNLETRARYFSWLAQQDAKMLDIYLNPRRREDMSGQADQDTAVSIRSPRLNFLSALGEQISEQESPEHREDILAKGASIEYEFLRAFPSTFQAYVEDRTRILRDDTTTESKLNEFIREFLDMRTTSSNSAASSNRVIGSVGDPIHLSTHPSAGLSYLRTNNVLDNHPILGPLSRRAPVKARVLASRSMNREGRPIAILGVGGFAVDEPAGFTGPTDDDTRVKELDLNVPGGQKIWVDMESAHVLPSGKVKIAVRRPISRDAVHVREGHLSHPQPAVPRLPLAANRRFDERLDSRGETAKPSESSHPHPTMARLKGLLDSDKANSKPRRP